MFKVYYTFEIEPPLMNKNVFRRDKFSEKDSLIFILFYYKDVTIQDDDCSFYRRVCYAKQKE